METKRCVRKMKQNVKEVHGWNVSCARELMYAEEEEEKEFFNKMR